MTESGGGCGRCSAGDLLAYSRVDRVRMRMLGFGCVSAAIGCPGWGVFEWKKSNAMKSRALNTGLEGAWCGNLASPPASNIGGTDIFLRGIVQKLPSAIWLICVPRRGAQVGVRLRLGATACGMMSRKGCVTNKDMRNYCAQSWESCRGAAAIAPSEILVAGARNHLKLLFRAAA